MLKLKDRHLSNSEFVFQCVYLYNESILENGGVGRFSEMHLTTNFFFENTFFVKYSELGALNYIIHKVSEKFRTRTNPTVTEIYAYFVDVMYMFSNICIEKKKRSSRIGYRIRFKMFIVG